jgi:hypothetical protein
MTLVSPENIMVSDEKFVLMWKSLMHIMKSNTGSRTDSGELHVLMYPRERKNF